MIRRISSGGPWEARVGYCRAVVAGGWVHVAGTVCPGEPPPDDVDAQCAGALGVIGTALAEAGAGFEDVVRARYILPDRRDFPACWPRLSATFGAHPPAATMIEAGLIDPRYRIEIEVTARLPESTTRLHPASMASATEAPPGLAGVEPGTRAAGLVFVTGMTGASPDGTMPDRAEAQFRAAFAQVAEVLAEAGLSLDDIVEMTSFHVGLAETFEIFDEVRRDVMRGASPAWTSVEVAGLRRPGARVEIRAVARAPDRDRTG